MLFSLLLYMVLRCIFRLAPPGEERDREVEMIVLRHQVNLLRRRAGRPKLRRRDRLFLATAASILPIDEPDEPVRFLIRDRDSKFSGSFDEVIRTEGIRTIRTPIRSPRANASAEPCVKTLRHEVLDWTLMLGRRHLDRVLASYACHYNAERNHRGIELRVPERLSRVDPVKVVPEVKRHDVLGRPDPRVPRGRCMMDRSFGTPQPLSGFAGVLVEAVRPNIQGAESNDRRSKFAVHPGWNSGRPPTRPVSVLDERM